MFVWKAFSKVFVILFREFLSLVSVLQPPDNFFNPQTQALGRLLSHSQVSAGKDDGLDGEMALAVRRVLDYHGSKYCLNSSHQS